MLYEAISQEQKAYELELKALRSDFLDAFADLESLVCLFLKDAGLLSKGPHFGAKVDEFRKVEGISRIAKVNLGKRDRLADRIRELLPIRADIVHSRMTQCEIGGSPASIFVNSQNRTDVHPPCRILKLEEMRSMCNQVINIIGDIKALAKVTPPSSPPPPSPGAAGDP